MTSSPSPEHHPKRVVVLGSTGSIGVNTLQVVGADRSKFSVFAISGHSKVDLLLEQACRFEPNFVICTSPEAAETVDWSDLPSNTRLLVGPQHLEAIVTYAEVDCVVAAIVGFAGLASTWAALESGKQVALANKEALVVAGPLMMSLATKSGGTLIPIDSEHSAIFQCIHAGRSDEVRRIILTASGGPFRNFGREQMACVSVDQALNHPTWNMGPKISIDSATMMNKALEMIEARWLFNLCPEQIEVMIHPQSIIHSMVEFRDGSVIGQLSPPDMKLPIEYALYYPQRGPGVAEKFDWRQAYQLELLPPDLQRFPALDLGWQVAEQGGTAGAVVNAANEAAVDRFLGGELDFLDIVPTCRRVLEQHDYEAHPSLEQLMAADAWARQEVSRWVCT